MSPYHSTPYHGGTVGSSALHRVSVLSLSLLRTVEQIADIPVPAHDSSTSSAISLDAPSELGDKVFRTLPKCKKNTSKTLDNLHAQSSPWTSRACEVVAHALHRPSSSSTVEEGWKRTCGALRITWYMACTTGNWAATLPTGHRHDQGLCQILVRADQACPDVGHDFPASTFIPSNLHLELNQRTPCQNLEQQ